MAPAKKATKRTAAARKTPAAKAAKRSAPSTARASMKKKSTKGPNEAAVEKHVEALRREQQLDTEGEVLAALALKLGELLDGGEPVTMTVAWARELRLALAALAPGGRGDDGDDGADDSWLADLPSPLRDAAQP